MTFNALAHFLSKIVPAVVTKGDVRAFTGKNLTKCSTNSSRSATYERALSFKQKTHQRFFS
jgi:hypothetical protein